MIINKASFERGFGYGCIYKSEFIDLREKAKTAKHTFAFGVISADPRLQCIGPDGFPYIGTRLENGDAFYWFVAPPPPLVTAFLSSRTKN
jgi:DNA-directed RNA polymerase I subunit RPA2